MDRNAIVQEIENAWRTRAAAQGLNPKSMAYKRAEVEFFVGAMAAMQAIQPGENGTMSKLAPPIWTINIISGRPVAGS